MHINPPLSPPLTLTQHRGRKREEKGQEMEEKGGHRHSPIHLSLLWFLTLLNVALLGAGVNTFYVNITLCTRGV